MRSRRGDDMRGVLFCLCCLSPLTWNYLDILYTETLCKPIRFDMIHLSAAFSVRIFEQVIYIHLTCSSYLTPIK